MPGIKLHPRLQLVTTAELDLQTRVLAWMKEHDELTTAEILMTLSSVLSHELNGILRLLLRKERHGTTDKKADEA